MRQEEDETARISREASSRRTPSMETPPCSIRRRASPFDLARPSVTRSFGTQTGRAPEGIRTSRTSWRLLAGKDLLELGGGGGRRLPAVIVGDDPARQIGLDILGVDFARKETPEEVREVR